MTNDERPTSPGRWPTLCRNLEREEWVALQDEHGRPLPGIRGKRGVAAPSATGREFGIDLIRMSPGAAFPLHTHAGDHILYVMEGEGRVHIDGVDHPVTPGDTIFIPARYPHGVKANAEQVGDLLFLAVGYPHRHVEAPDRMTLVHVEEEQ
jgi:quercetin dioxygenase-like cupin family protein